MLTRVVCVMGVFVLVAPAFAQEPRIEFGAGIGRTLSEGVRANAVVAGDGNIYRGVDPRDSASWRFNVGVLATDNVEVGLLFSQQKSTLQAEGATSRDIGDMTINTYHGYLAYTFRSATSRIRPYLMGGLGATRASNVSFTAAGQNRDIPGETQFSTTWGAGLKVLVSPHVGIKNGVRWTPTYTKAGATGWSCDPYWGCYVTGSAQYANQIEFGSGIILRF